MSIFGKNSPVSRRSAQVVNQLTQGRFGNTQPFSALIQARDRLEGEIPRFFDQLGAGRRNAIDQQASNERGALLSNLFTRGFGVSSGRATGEVGVEARRQGRLTNLESELLGQRLAVEGGLQNQRFQLNESDIGNIDQQRLTAAEILGGELQAAIQLNLQQQRQASQTPFTRFG